MAKDSKKSTKGNTSTRSNNLMAKRRTWSNLRNDEPSGEVCMTKSITIPDQALSIGELIKRNARGQELPKPQRLDEELEMLRRMNKLDAIDHVRRETQEMNRRIEKQKHDKKEEAEKKAYNQLKAKYEKDNAGSSDPPKPDAKGKGKKQAPDTSEKED